jgi:hypothetical protein
MTPQQFFTPLAEDWKKRRSQMSYNVGSKAEAKAQLKFMLGAVACLRAFGTDGMNNKDALDVVGIVGYITFIISCGRSIVSEMDVYAARNIAL